MVVLKPLSTVGGQVAHALVVAAETSGSECARDGPFEMHLLADQSCFGLDCGVEILRRGNLMLL